MSPSACLCSIFLLNFFASLSAQYKPQFLQSTCSPTIYPRNSSYFSNLKTLLSSLSDSKNTTFFSNRFQSNSLGDESSDNIVSGFFLCRGDLPPEQCRDCVVLGVNDTLTSRCLGRKEAMNDYDVCTIRYADRNVLSDSAGTDGLPIQDLEFMNSLNVTANQVDEFSESLFSLLNEAAEEASNSSRKFAAKKANFRSSQNTYVMVQCIPVLNRPTCMTCLQMIFDVLPRYKIGGRIVRPMCDVRYERYPFYNETLVEINLLPPVSPPPQPAVSAPPKPGKGKKGTVIIIAIAVSLSVFILLSVAIYCFFTKKVKKTFEKAATPHDDGDDTSYEGSLQYDFKQVEAATNNFSESNKLGQGGFGEVFKGTLPNELEVAVKRLSKTSGQGEREFKNEVVVVAKLQHRNLVRLLGFCLEREEKILIYEFVPNKSLDYFLFDSTMQSQLDWKKRYNIIGGIARGMLYLHQDSRVTIIHRDLKAGNILLDADMNPKVADFGMARIFGINQTQASTNIIAGTYGYMSPEYAMYGHFSKKSDVFSFGVLILEIISGKMNTSVFQKDGGEANLVAYAWKLWNNGWPLELVDPSFQQNYQEKEITKCIHIALLCVQEVAEDRPTMSDILQMLTTTSSITLPVPQAPGYLFRNVDDKVVGRSGSTSDVSSSIFSIGDTSITRSAPR